MRSEDRKKWNEREQGNAHRERKIEVDSKVSDQNDIAPKRATTPGHTYN